MYKSSWRALSFGAELLHTIHVATRPRTAQPRNRGSIPGTDKNFFISLICPDNSTVHLTGYSTDRGVSFLWDKTAPEADFSPPFSSVAVKKE